MRQGLKPLMEGMDKNMFLVLVAEMIPKVEMV